MQNKMAQIGIFYKFVYECFITERKEKTSVSREDNIWFIGARVQHTEPFNGKWKSPHLVLLLKCYGFLFLQNAVISFAVIFSVNIKGILYNVYFI